MNNKLKACPFCHGKAILCIRNFGKSIAQYKVKCSNCGVTQADYTFDKYDAIWSWNRRDVIGDIAAKIKEYKANVSSEVTEHIDNILKMIEIEDDEGDEV